MKVLIANRGEIAVRIIRACHDLGISTVAVYSQADAESLHVFYADEAVCIGEPAAHLSYLKKADILSACEITGADAIHPGYGFLSENADFASICDSCGIIFVGPSAETMRLLGDKAVAKATAKRAGCPIIPGSDGVVPDLDTAFDVAAEMGYPLLVKAVAGGGGRGIRCVNDESELARNFTAASEEARISFGNGEVYMEKVIESPRHVEIQVMGDTHGNYVHLGERDCSIQRRRQKLIEEAPSPVLSSELRKEMGQKAIDIVKSVGYHSVGTVEFLVDRDNNYYFMEVNTRIQVEHTVTEELTGVDLVVEQLHIAMGEKLSVSQEDISFNGHVIQCRINAEDPDNNFSPSPGRLEYYLPPGGPHVRVDSACYSGYVIPSNYDSMIAKLIVRGKDREDALARMRRALREFYIEGVRSTIPFHRRMLDEVQFIAGDYDLTYLDTLIEQGDVLTPSS
jgi:acetyl-CoA carboxylase, biotin carboxylase subunit